MYSYVDTYTPRTMKVDIAKLVLKIGGPWPVAGHSSGCDMESWSARAIVHALQQLLSNVDEFKPHFSPYFYILHPLENKPTKLVTLACGSLYKDSIDMFMVYKKLNDDIKSRVIEKCFEFMCGHLGCPSISMKVKPHHLDIIRKIGGQVVAYSKDSKNDDEYECVWGQNLQAHARRVFEDLDCVKHLSPYKKFRSCTACSKCPKLDGGRRITQCPCKTVWYCSRKCQAAHWPKHKCTCLYTQKEKQEKTMSPILALPTPDPGTIRVYQPRQLPYATLIIIIAILINLIIGVV